MQDWGHLPWPILHEVMAHLSAALCADGALPVAAALQAAVGAAPNRWWRWSAETEVNETQELWLAASIPWLTVISWVSAVRRAQPGFLPARLTARGSPPSRSTAATAC